MAASPSVVDRSVLEVHLDEIALFCCIACDLFHSSGDRAGMRYGRYLGKLSRAIDRADEGFLPLNPASHVFQPCDGELASGPSHNSATATDHRQESARHDRNALVAVDVAHRLFVFQSG